MTHQSTNHATVTITIRKSRDSNIWHCLLTGHERMAAELALSRRARRRDGLRARVGRARQDMEGATAASDERRRVLTGIKGIWRRNLNAWLRRSG